jgi:prepilin signal peptidase PulO-like enzyme (type II secretory pathway)
MTGLFQIYAFIFGLLIGSFLNVVILRLPRGKGLILDRSACPSCGTRLKWYHNIPVMSFLLLRGKCAFCGARISWRYPLIEILTGLVSFWLFPEIFRAETLGEYAFLFTLACIFIVHFFIDLDHQLLLDSLNLYLLAIILGYSLFHFSWPYWVLGGSMGFGIPLFITWIFYKVRGQVGLGGGDIKLYGILGLYLGPTGIIFNIFLSCLLGAVVGLALIGLGKLSKEKPMAFGPAILIVATFQIYFPELNQVLQTFFFW